MTRRLHSCVILFCFLVWPPWLVGQSAADAAPGLLFSELEPRQQELIGALLAEFTEVTGQAVDVEEAFDSAPVSVRSTYHAVTNALGGSALTGTNGEALGTPLDLIESLETIRGRVRGEGGDVQFRVYALLRADAYERLDASQEFRRGPDNTVYHKGYPISFRQQGGPPSIQFSMSRDQIRADIDVDYRSSKFPSALFNGHLTAANSDVRAGANFDRHIGRWTGLTKWWTELFGLGLLSTTSVRPDDEAASQQQMTIPERPAKGRGKLHEAAADFFSALFVRGAARDAVSYLSPQAYACWVLQGETDGRPLRRAIAPYFALSRFRAAQEELSAKVGQVDALSQVIEGIDIEDQRGLRPYKKNPHDSEFRLYRIAEGAALKWSCATRLSGSVPPKRDSQKFGKYFLAVFRVRVADTPTKAGVLFGKERGVWKVLTFESEAEVDHSSVPDLRTDDAVAVRPKTVEADEAFLRAVRGFHREWFITRRYSEALASFSPETLACGADYLQEGQDAPRDLDELLQRWRRAMSRTAEVVGSPGRLADSISAVEPATSELTVVRHPDEEAYTIFALSDAAGVAERCSNRGPGYRRAHAEPYQAAPEGNYYAASLEVQAAGGRSALLTTFWERSGQSDWKIYSYRIDTP